MMKILSVVLLGVVIVLAACQSGSSDPLFSGYLTQAAGETTSDPTGTPLSTPTELPSPASVMPAAPAAPVATSADSALPEADPAGTPTSSAATAPAEAAEPSVRATAAPTLVGPPSPTSPPTEAPSATPTPDTPVSVPLPPLNPAGRVGLGAYLEGTPYDGFAAVRRFEGLVGHRMQYVLWFQAWGDDDRSFAGQWIALAAQSGAIPVITWEPWRRDFANPTAEQPEYSLAGIAAGDHDDYIRGWASAAAGMGVPMVLRFAHEQSTEPGTRSWYPWQGDPEGYRAAFRHIVGLFREAGAANVQFLWSAMWLDGWASEYYPGDDVVDLIGTTVLNHGTAVTTPWAQWRTFGELFGGQYRAAAGWGKPIILTELGTAEQGGDKAAWLREVFTSLGSSYPLVSGVLLLEVESDREWPAINWSVGSSPGSLNTFRQAVSDPYFK
jgi:hypothetical protein